MLSKKEESYFWRALPKSSLEERLRMDSVNEGT